VVSRLDNGISTYVGTSIPCLLAHPTAYMPARAFRRSASLIGPLGSIETLRAERVVGPDVDHAGENLN
jgi:hypothetical protein